MTSSSAVGPRSFCIHGFDVDLEVSADTAALYRFSMGRAELGGAIRAGQLTMSDPRTLQRGFGQWFSLGRVRPGEPLGAGAAYSRLTRCRPSSRTIAFAKAHRGYPLVKAGERIAPLRSRRSVASLLKGERR